MRYFDLYHALAEQSHHALLSLVVAQAENKDLQSLSEFVHSMDQMGVNVRLFSDSKEATVTYRQSESAGGDDAVQPRASFPRALIAAISPSACHDDGTKKTHTEKFKEVMTDEAMHFLSGVVKIGTTEISKAFENPKKRERFLSSMLFHAASTTSDPRVFHTLIDAGANPNAKFVTNYAEEADTTVPLLKEALQFGNFQGATALLSRMVPVKAVEEIVGMTEGPRDPGTSQAVAFHDLNSITLMRYGLKNGEHKAVGDLLDTICERAQALGSGGDRGQRVGGIFRCLLASSYLRAVASHFDTDWTDEAITALKGQPGAFKAHSTLEGMAIEWNDATTNSGRSEERWALMKPMENISKTSYIYMMADLAHQAVRANCTPILKDMGSLIAPVDSKRFKAPDIGIAVYRAVIYKPQVDAIRLRATIEVLMSYGHSINAPYAHHEKSGTPLHVLSMAAEPSVAIALPILLTLGADRNAVNKDGNTPRQAHESQVAQATWDNIERSFDARNAAHGILSELEDLGHETPTTSKPPKP